RIQGKEGQIQPDMSDEFVESITNRYIELYEHITGRQFERGDYSHIESRIENNVNAYLASL
ncbi:MAG: phosphoribosylaminoimidazolesuccinocarboxamide synthase, partial [Bacteroidota bacterium]